MTKICGKCKSEKDHKDFTVDRSSKDEKHHLCRACLYARQNEYKNKPGRLEAIRSYKRKYGQSEIGRLKSYESSRRHSETVGCKFTNSRSRAKRVGLSWTITREQYISFSAKPCEYCGGPLPKKSTGLDRLNNSLGYDFENVVPCCALCNYARRDQFTVEEMRLFIGPAVAAVRASRSKLTKVQS